MSENGGDVLLFKLAQVPVFEIRVGLVPREALKVALQPIRVKLSAQSFK